MSINFENSIKTIKEWIAIKSEKTTPEENAPFGVGVKDMLEKALFDAKNLGFEVKNYDNYIGEVIYGSGSDEDGVAVLCHLDVVPAGDLSKWDTPPYECVQKDGYLIGRGVVDDKGAAAVCLHALKELKDEGFVPSKKIKLIFGCDEESGWGCIEHYNKVAVMPKIGFSPDSHFPVLYAEKGILHIKYEFDKNKDLIAVNGGERANVVCDKASVKTHFNSVEFLGKSAHGSTPEAGDNAIKKALLYLVENSLFNRAEYLGLFENDLASKFNDESGILTFSPNVITTIGDKINVIVDIRYPVHTNVKELEEELKKVGIYRVLEHKEPLYADKNGKLVTTLLSIYDSYTGTKSIPLTTGGGTYARALENGVAFGPFEGDGPSCHIPNEKIKISQLEKCFNIYKQAIKELSK